MDERLRLKSVLRRDEPALPNPKRRNCLMTALTAPLAAGLSACGGGESWDAVEAQRRASSALPAGALPTPTSGQALANPVTTVRALSTTTTTPAPAPAPPPLGNPLVPANPLRNYVFGPARSVFATGGANVGVGEMVLRNVRSGSGNTALGDQVLWQLQGGINCTGVGHLALFGAQEAVDCTAVGAGALQTMQSGVGATAVGRLAASAMRFAENTTAIGDSALRYAVSGEANTSVGYRAHEGNLTGDHNVCLGALAGLELSSGRRNVLVGFSAMSQTRGDATENVAVGAYALDSCAGHANVAVGVGAGRALQSGDRNVFVGSNAGTSDQQLRGVTNSIAIGDGAYTTQNNQAVIGNAETDTVVLAGVRFTRAQLQRLIELIGP